MHFSDEQKEVIRSIATGAIHDAFTYLVTSKSGSLVLAEVYRRPNRENEAAYLRTSPLTWQEGLDIDLNKEANLFFMIKDEPSVRQGLTDLISLLASLEEESLVVKLKDSTSVNITKYLNRLETCLDVNEPFLNGAKGEVSLRDDFFHNGHNTNVPTLLNFKFVPTSEMKEFVQNNFKTRAERSGERQERIGTIGLVTAIVTSVLSLGLNVWSNIEAGNNYKETKESFQLKVDELKGEIGNLRSKIPEGLNEERLFRSLDSLGERLNELETPVR